MIIAREAYPHLIDLGDLHLIEGRVRSVTCSFFVRMKGRTIQDVIDSGETIRAYCHAYLCNHNAVLDMLTLRDRFGPDHGAMHGDLVPKLRCTKCGGRKIGIISTPGTKEYGGNPYQKAGEGR